MVRHPRLRCIAPTSSLAKRWRRRSVCPLTDAPLSLQAARRWHLAPRCLPTPSRGREAGPRTDRFGNTNFDAAFVTTTCCTVAGGLALGLRPRRRACHAGAAVLLLVGGGAAMARTRRWRLAAGAAAKLRIVATTTERRRYLLSLSSSQQQLVSLATTNIHHASAVIEPCVGSDLSKMNNILSTFTQMWWARPPKKNAPPAPYHHKTVSTTRRGDADRQRCGRHGRERTSRSCQWQTGASAPPTARNKLRSGHHTWAEKRFPRQDKRSRGKHLSTRRLPPQGQRSCKKHLRQPPWKEDQTRLRRRQLGEEQRRRRRLLRKPRHPRASPPWTEVLRLRPSRGAAGQAPELLQQPDCATLLESRGAHLQRLLPPQSCPQGPGGRRRRDRRSYGEP